MKDKLIIFDMDNTLLQSRIDFALMRERVHAMLDDLGLQEYKHNSLAYSILQYAESPDYQPQVAQRVWDEISEIEKQGIEQAVLEPGAGQALQYLAAYAELAVLTNNTGQNLEQTLGRLGLLPYLGYVAGRDSVPKMKPAPDGMLHIMAQFPHIAAANTLAVGDARIDADAAGRAGIGFVSYNRSRIEDWDGLGIRPLLRLNCWDQTSCRRLAALLAG